MMNKKGINVLEVIFGLVIVGTIAILILNFSAPAIKDAGDEFMKLLNLNTANCDHDKDGIPSKADLCPCDSDNYFNSRIRYISDETGCEVYQDCRGYPDTYDRTDLCTAQIAKDNPESLKVEADAFQYYFLLSDKDCKLWYDKKGSELMQGCTEDPTNENRVSFNDECARKVLAWYQELNRPIFQCKTPMSECKKILKKSC